MCSNSPLEIGSDFDIERAERLVELGIRIRFLFFGGEGEGERYWDPGEARLELAHYALWQR